MPICMSSDQKTAKTQKQHAVSEGHEMLKWIRVSSAWYMIVKSALKTQGLEFVS